MLVCTFESHMHKMCCTLNFEYVSKMPYIAPRCFREVCWTLPSVYNSVLTWNLLWDRSKRERKSKMDNNRKHLRMKMCAWKWLFHQPIVDRKMVLLTPRDEFRIFWCDILGERTWHKYLPWVSNCSPPRCLTCSRNSPETTGGGLNPKEKPQFSDPSPAVYLCKKPSWNHEEGVIWHPQ